MNHKNSDVNGVYWYICRPVSEKTSKETNKCKRVINWLSWISDFSFASEKAQVIKIANWFDWSGHYTLNEGETSTWMEQNYVVCSTYLNLEIQKR